MRDVLELPRGDRGGPRDRTSHAVIDVRRVVVVIVNSLSRLRTHWDASEAPSGSFQILLKAAGRIVRASPELKRLPDDAGARVVPDQAGTAPEVS